MSFAQNIQFLRKMHQGMTQEELAEKLAVSRQTVSKWETGSAYPEMEKALALCKLFTCTLDELLVGSISSDNEAYSNIRIETMPPTRYVRYTVISAEPEDDAKNHMTGWAGAHGIAKPEIIGWDFPYLSQEQINVYHLHGYTTACLLPEGLSAEGCEVLTQPAQRYAAITIQNPFANPFTLIPNAYKTLMRYMDVNQLIHKETKDVISCFEKEYTADGQTYMDVFIAMQP